MLDLRLPMGLMFSIVGGMLVLYGLFTGGDAEMYKRSLDMNVNLWWGMVLLAFGLVMFGMAHWDARKEKQEGS